MILLLFFFSRFSIVLTVFYFKQMQMQLARVSEARTDLERKTQTLESELNEERDRRTQAETVLERVRFKQATKGTY